MIIFMQMSGIIIATRLPMVLKTLYLMRSCDGEVTVSDFTVQCIAYRDIMTENDAWKTNVFDSYIDNQSSCS